MSSLRSQRTGFALISVLALVSLAALTATAFLASARLEGQATRSIGDSLRLQMALNAGRECAIELLDYNATPNFGWSFVTTYWRTNISDELGYLLIGCAASKNNLRWTYWCGFSPATFTELNNTVIQPFISFTNTVCQATFSNDAASFMRTATAGLPRSEAEAATNPRGTLIPMLGNQTSPPVGWVYIRQEMRTNSSSTNTVSLPVARFAYFIQDLGGLIDAERMGAGNNRNTGINPEEISLPNLVVGNIAGTDYRIAGPANLGDYTNKRPQYLTPGMMMSANGGILTNTNDLRYFATRLRYCNWSDGINWDRIPVIPLRSSRPNYPTNAGYLKYVLNTNTTNTNANRIAIAHSNLAATILTNFPDFTIRAGGMRGTNYVYALAANILNYVGNNEINSRFPVTASIPGDPNGMTAIGFGNYPIPTIIFDQQQRNANSLILNSYWQFWNCSTLTSPPVNYRYVYDYADTVMSTSNRITTNTITDRIGIPRLPPGGTVVIRAISNVVLSLGTNPPINCWLNGTGNGQRTTNNALIIYKDTANLGPSNIIFRLMTGFERAAKNVTNGEIVWSGGMPGLRYDNCVISNTNTSAPIPPIGDPRMANYFTNNQRNGYLSACDWMNNTEWFLGYAQTRTPKFTLNDPYSGHPGNWPDGTNSALQKIFSLTPAPTSLSTVPSTNVSSNAVMRYGISSLAKLSANAVYTNICELGNVFDPIQWVSTSITNAVLWVNCDISPSNTWSANSMYGGGQTLRIGRPEHSRFAFTNIAGNATNSYPIPSLGTSAAGLLDLITTTNTYDWAGKININTAPPAVLAALAGGIRLSQDPSRVGDAINATMISQFTNGVMRFRNLYPFISASQLAFISSSYGNPGWTNSSLWPIDAVFSTSRYLTPSNGVTSLNDQGREEWFSKIYNLTTVQSFNYRVYVVAQLLNTNGTPRGATMRKYYQVYLRNNSPDVTSARPGENPGDRYAPNVSRTVTYEAFY